METNNQEIRRQWPTSYVAFNSINQKFYFNCFLRQLLLDKC